MNSIKIQSRKDLTPERHDARFFNIKKIKLFDKNYELYQPCPIHIFVTDDCNYQCSFCCNKDLNCKQNYFDNYETFKKEKQNIFLNNLKKLLENVSKEEYNFESIITGGEPCLYPKFLSKIFTILNEYNIKSRSFLTNGTNLFQKLDNSTVFDYLLVHNMIDEGFINNVEIFFPHYEFPWFFYGISQNYFESMENLNFKNLLLLKMIFETNYVDYRFSTILSKKIFKADVLTFENIGFNHFTDIYNKYEYFKNNLKRVNKTVTVKSIGFDFDTITEYQHLMSKYGSSFMYREQINQNSPDFVSCNEIIQEYKKRKMINYLDTFEGLYYDIDIYERKDLNQIYKHYKPHKANKEYQNKYENVITSIYFKGNKITGRNVKGDIIEII